MDIRKMIATGVMVGKKATATQLMLQKFIGGGDEVAVAYYPLGNSGGAPTLSLLQHLGQKKYLWMEIDYGTGTVGSNPPVLAAGKMIDFYSGFGHDTTPSLSTDFSWSANAAYYGGGYYFASAANKFIQLTTNNDVEWVGAGFVPAFARGGMLLCSIDGNTTLAELLPTAQDLVTLGTLADTALVANGGTLNPTDRVIDTYNLVGNFQTTKNKIKTVIFSKALTKGSHIVKLTQTAYKNINAESGIFTGVSLVFTSGPTASGIGASSLPVFNLLSACGGGGADEISYSFTPTGATSSAWLGHQGQAKLISEPSISIDGSPVTLTASFLTGKTITMLESNSIRHPEIGGGATSLGTYDLSYTLDSVTGLTISHVVTWDTTGTVGGYPCMMSVDHVNFNRFNTLGNVAKDLTANDDSKNLNSSNGIATAWLDTGNIGRLLYIPDLSMTVNNWLTTTEDQRMWWSDVSASGGTWKKCYVNRFKTSIPLYSFSNGESWSALANHRVAWFPNGANSALS